MPVDYDCNGGPYSLGIGDSITNNYSSLTFNDFRVYSYNNTPGSYATGGTLWIQDTLTGNAEDWLYLYDNELTESTQFIYTNWTAQASDSYPPYIQFHNFGGGITSEYCSNTDKAVYYP